MKQILLFDFIVPMGEQEPIEKGFLLLENNLIQDIGSQTALPQHPDDCQVLEFRDSVCFPGFINCHTHLAYPRYYKEVEANKQIDWIHGLVQHSRKLPLESKLKIAQNNVQLCLKSGTTFVVENTPFKETVEAIANSPLKALVGLEVFGNDSQKADETFKYSMRFLHEMETKYKQNTLQFTLSPHAIYNVSASLLQKLMQWAQEHNKLLLTHLSEFDFEVDLVHNGFPSQELSSFNQSLKLTPPDLSGLSKLSPVEYMSKINCLNSRLLATHLVKASPKDIQLLAERAVKKVISCLRSNVYLNNGLPLLSLMHEMGLQIAFATDGLSSNFDLSLLREIKEAWLLSKSFGYNLKAERFFEGITSIPAQHLGLQSSIGSLAKGKQADLVCFQLEHSSIQDLQQIKNKEDFFFFLLSSLTNEKIHQVFIDGKPC